MKMSASEYKKLPYTIEIIPDGDVFFVRIKELPGCISQGDTIEEAYDMIEEAKNIWIEAALEDGYEFPLPESMQEKKFSGKLSLRIPKSLHKNLAMNAKSDGVSLNQYITTCLVEQNTMNNIFNKMEETNKKIDYTINTLESASFVVKDEATRIDEKKVNYQIESNDKSIHLAN